MTESQLLWGAIQANHNHKLIVGAMETIKTALENGYSICLCNTDGTHTILDKPFKEFHDWRTDFEEEETKC